MTPKEQQALMRDRITNPTRLKTTFTPNMTFRQFWLKNFPALLARFGYGPKRLRKKRLKKVLAAAFLGHNLTYHIKERLAEKSFASMILPDARLS